VDDFVQKTLLDAAYRVIRLMGSKRERELLRTLDHANEYIAIHDELVNAILTVDPNYERPRLEQELAMCGDAFPGKNADWCAAKGREDTADVSRCFLLPFRR